MSSQSNLYQHRPATIHQQNRVTLFWLTTSAGAMLFVTFQLFFYVNGFVRTQGITPTMTFAPDILWVFPTFYGCWIITVLLTLIGTRNAQWVALAYKTAPKRNLHLIY